MLRVTGGVGRPATSQRPRVMPGGTARSGREDAQGDMRSDGPTVSRPGGALRLRAWAAATRAYSGSYATANGLRGSAKLMVTIARWFLLMVMVPLTSCPPRDTTTR